MIPGDVSLIRYIRDCLDTGSDFDDAILLSKEDSPDKQDDREGYVGGSGNLKPTSSSLSVSHLETHGVSLPLGVHSMAEALLRFLEALPEPVIPFALYGRCIALGMKGDKIQAAEVRGLVGKFTHSQTRTYTRTPF